MLWSVQVTSATHVRLGCMPIYEQATYPDVIVKGRVIGRRQGNTFPWLSDAVDQVVDNGAAARRYGQVFGLQVQALHGL